MAGYNLLKHKDNILYILDPLVAEIAYNDGFVYIKNSPTVMIDPNYIIDIATDNKTIILAKKDNTSDNQKWTLTRTGRSSKILLFYKNVYNNKPLSQELI